MASSDRTFRLEIVRSALREWAGLATREERRSVADVLERLSTEPRPPNSFRLVGRHDFRVQAANVVVSYALDEEARVVTVLRVRRWP